MAALLLTAAGPASAQLISLPRYKRGLKSLGLAVGRVAPTATEGFSKAVEPALGAGLEFLYFPSGWFALGAELGYQPFKSKALPGPPEVTTEATAVHFGALARLHFLEDRSWTPYAVGGAGLHQVDLALDAGPKTQTSSLMVTAGGGIEGFVLRGLSLGLEARWRRYKVGRDSAVESLGTIFKINVWF